MTAAVAPTVSATDRGRRALLALAAALGLGLLFLDPLMLALASAAGAFLVVSLADALRTRRDFRRMALLTPDGFSVGLVRGQGAELSSHVVALKDLEFRPTGALTASPLALKRGEADVTFAFRPGSIGEHHVGAVDASLRCAFGLFSVKGPLRLEVRAKVYPRFVAAIARAAQLLARRGTEGEEQETEAIGDGLEYAETREYTPGDSLRRMDWKATARSGTLMVKRFQREGGEAAHVIYLLGAAGPSAGDELATEFVNLLYSAAGAGTPLTVTIYDREKRVLHLSGPATRRLMASSFEVVLRSARVPYDDVRSVLDILPSSHAARLAARATLEGWAKAAGRPDPASSARLADLAPLLPAHGGSYVVLTSLLGQLSGVLDMIAELRRRSADVSVAYPARPWMDAPTLEEAYLMRASLERARRSMAALGCEARPLAAGAALTAADSSTPPVR